MQAVAPLAHARVIEEPWWRDPRFVIPSVFVGLTIASSLAFALGHRLWARQKSSTEEPKRDDKGFAFPETTASLQPGTVP